MEVDDTGICPLARALLRGRRVGRNPTLLDDAHQDIDGLVDSVAFVIQVLDASKTRTTNGTNKATLSERESKANRGGLGGKRGREAPFRR
jgi:hypothetical protein